MNDNVIKEFIDSIRGEEINKDVIYSATISHVDNEGVVWVFLPGANKATPTESSSADVRSGDVVNVQWQNNKLYILGNYSNPSAGMTQMRQAEQSANRAREAAGMAQDVADEALTKAEKAGKAAAYFWHTETDTGAGAGAHITQVPQADFLADPTHGGGNNLLDTEGLKIRDGLTEVAKFSKDKIELAKNSMYSKISLCKIGQLYVDEDPSDQSKILVLENNNEDGQLAIVSTNDSTLHLGHGVSLTYFNHGTLEIYDRGINLSGGLSSLELLNEGVYINSNKLDDFFTKIGVSGNWVYRWAASGRKEAWCSYSGSSATAEVWASPIRYRDININIPQGVFDSAPRVYANSYSNQSWVVSANATSATTLSVRIATVASGAITPSLRLYCVQG